MDDRLAAEGRFGSLEEQIEGLVVLPEGRHRFPRSRTAPGRGFRPDGPWTISRAVRLPRHQKQEQDQPDGDAHLLHRLPLLFLLCLPVRDAQELLRLGKIGQAEPAQEARQADRGRVLL